MPITTSDFKTSFPFTNKHISTVYRTLFTNPKVFFTRKRVLTKDDDFIDLDFSLINSKNCVLLIHGLEGSSNSKYILSTTLELNKANLDVIVFNLRGCSGTINKQLRTYHSGEINDLEFVINFLSTNYSYSKLGIIGFSLGGNMTLKFLGEQLNHKYPFLKCAMAVSPPCDLKGSSIELAKKSNQLYMKRFLKTLISKALHKAQLYPEQQLNIAEIKNSKSFLDFDNLFTAPVFGFLNAEDYWKRASSLSSLNKITLPTYLLTAQDDPFLSDSCYPLKAAKENKFLTLELTKFGGHMGFTQSFIPRKNKWLERKIIHFMANNLDE